LSKRVPVAVLLAVTCLIPATDGFARPVNLDRTVFVSPVPGNPVASGNRLWNALAHITTASADNPWLIKIEPGIFDLNGRSLVLKPHVDIEGSGRETTIIFSTVESVGTVQGADFVELRELTVRNHAAVRALALSNRSVFFRAARVACWARGGSESAVGIFNSVPGGGGSFEDVAAVAHVTEVATGISATSGVFQRVHATGVGTRFAWGLFNQASIAEIDDLTARAVGDSYAAAIRNEAGRPLLRNVRAIGRGENISEGIVNGAGSAAVLQDALVDVTGGADFAAGIRNEFSSASVTGAVITVAGAGNGFGVTSSFSGTPSIANATIEVTAAGAAVGIQADETQTTVEASRVVSSGIALRNSGLSAATSINVGASRVEGTVQPGAGTLRCAASYDGSFAALGANCLP
jgi:hypothetical protein